MEKYIYRPKCILTGKDNLEHLHTFYNFPVFMGCVDSPQKNDIFADMTWGICPDTGMIQLLKVIDLQLVYQQPHNDAFGETWQRHNTALALFIHDFQPNSIVEIGGGNGNLAKIYTDSYSISQYTVIEPNPTFTSSKKINIIQGWFDENTLFPVGVDTVVHSNLLEHIYQPMDFLAHISNKLEIGQKHILSIPNMLKSLKKSYPNQINFEHTYLLQENHMEWMFCSCGFDILRKTYHEDFIFYALKKSINTKIKLDIANNYTESKKIFQNFVNYQTNMVSNINQQLKSFQGNVYIFGSHIFTQYSIYFGLNIDRITGVLDNSPLKFGHRLYGTKLYSEYPVVIQDDKSVGVVLNVANYKEEIMNQLKSINADVVIFDGNNHPSKCNR